MQRYKKFAVFERVLGDQCRSEIPLSFLFQYIEDKTILTSGILVSSSKVDWTNKTKALLLKHRVLSWQKKNDYNNTVFWKAVYQRIISFQAKEIGLNYLYLKVCSNFIYISTKNKSNKSTEYCFSVIYILHPQCLTMVLIHHTLPLKYFLVPPSASSPLPIHFSIPILSYSSKPSLFNLQEAAHCYM